MIIILLLLFFKEVSKVIAPSTPGCSQQNGAGLHVSTPYCILTLPFKGIHDRKCVCSRCKTEYKYLPLCSAEEKKLIGLPQLEDE